MEDVLQPGSGGMLGTYAPGASSVLKNISSDSSGTPR